MTPEDADEIARLVLSELRRRQRVDATPLRPSAEAAVVALIHASEQRPGSTGGTSDDESANVEITARQAASHLACSPGFVRRLARSGRLKGHKAGPVWLIDKASLDAYRYGGTPHDQPPEHDGGDR
jgi:excisionase family DNA binding protein